MNAVVLSRAGFVEIDFLIQQFPRIIVFDILINL